VRSTRRVHQGHRGGAPIVIYTFLLGITYITHNVWLAKPMYLCISKVSIFINLILWFASLCL